MAQMGAQMTRRGASLWRVRQAGRQLMTMASLRAAVFDLERHRRPPS